MHGILALPPFYAFGVYHGSNDYDKLDEIKNIATQYSTLAIPLEGLILDNYNAHPN